MSKEKLSTSNEIADHVRIAEAELGENGRVLLRASGTEALVRVMVEASSDSVATEIATRIAGVVEKELG